MTVSFHDDYHRSHDNMGYIGADITEANAHATNKEQYFFLSKLGNGSFGTVLKAIDKVNDQLVAIKIVKVLHHKPTALHDAHQEADILLRLQHPNVLSLKTYYKFKIKHNQVGLAMVTEYCSQGSLQMYLEDKASKNERDDKKFRLNWFSQLSEGLNFIHSKHIVHRDLKPPNILVTSNNTLKIGDVGLAKVVLDIKSKELAETSFYQYMSSITGTPCYMAPEVWEEHYQMSIDVFSLGLIFVMITEVPQPPVPKAMWNADENCLGVIMYQYYQTHKESPTSLMVPSLQFSDEFEIELFDSMLQYDSTKYGQSY